MVHVVNFLTSPFASQYHDPRRVKEETPIQEVSKQLEEMRTTQALMVEKMENDQHELRAEMRSTTIVTGLAVAIVLGLTIFSTSR